eukprot:759071-Hanusia_phi.AAC.4
MLPQSVLAQGRSKERNSQSKLVSHLDLDLLRSRSVHGLLHTAQMSITLAILIKACLVVCKPSGAGAECGDLCHSQLAGEWEKGLQWSRRSPAPWRTGPTSSRFSHPRLAGTTNHYRVLHLDASSGASANS